MKREEHPRLLAVLDQPQLAVIISGLDQANTGVGAVAEALQLMGSWPRTRQLSLLLSPDSQRSSHPGADLEPERRPMVELGTGLSVQPGSLVVWC